MYIYKKLYKKKSILHLMEKHYKKFKKKYKKQKKEMVVAI